MIDKQKIFNEFNKHLLEDEKPSTYFEEVAESKKLQKIYPFNFLFDLMKVEQNPKHHPEGNVWKHTMMVVDKAAENRHLSEEAKVFMWAALLHDIGKYPTTKLRKGKITAYNHDKVGKEMTIEFLTQFDCDENFVKRVAALVRWHMQPLFVVKNMPFAEIHRMLEECSADEIALLSISDRLGRGNLPDYKIEEEKENIKSFLTKVKLNNN